MKMHKIFSMIVCFLLCSCCVLFGCGKQPEKPYIDMTNRNKIEIGGYNGITEERIDRVSGATIYAKESDFSLLQELGIDVIFMTYQPHFGAAEIYNNYLDWLDKYHIKAYIRDVELNEKLAELAQSLDFSNESLVMAAVQEILPLINRYSARPLFRGNFLVDEPLDSELELYGKSNKLYQKAMPKHHMYVNLLPNYATQSKDDDAKFESYLRKYIDNFDVSYISQDHYPIHTKQGTDGKLVKTLYASDYYKGMYMPALVAKENNRDYGNYIWTIKNLDNEENRNYSPSIQDLRFEAFNSLAFGVSKINLFCASTPPLFVDKGDGIISNGTKTAELWDNSKQIISEIKFLSDVYCQYLWKDAASFYAGEGYGSTMAISLKGKYNPYVKDISSDTDLLIGLFDKANADGNAFMIVNNCDIASPKETKILFSLDSAKKVTVFQGTTSSVLEKNAHGKYALNLMAGQGAFVTVEK